MRENPEGVKFSDLYFLCVEAFGAPRKSQSGSSHVVFKMPWGGNPRVNIQDQKGMAKKYQVKQVLAAIDRVREESQ